MTRTVGASSFLLSVIIRLTAEVLKQNLCKKTTKSRVSPNKKLLCWRNH